MNMKITVIALVAGCLSVASGATAGEIRAAYEQPKTGGALPPESPMIAPIAMPVSDLHFSELLGILFEFRVGAGRCLVCGYPIGDPKSPEARQLRRSILSYAASSAFRPKAVLTPAAFATLFTRPGPTAAAEKERYLTPFEL